MKEKLQFVIKRLFVAGIFFLLAVKVVAYTPPTALRVLWVEGGVSGSNSHIWGDYITNVTFAGINNTTAGSGAKEWHTDYGRTTPQVTPGEVTMGQTYSFSVTLAGSDYPYDYVAVYVDWNQNNVNGTMGSPLTLDANENPLVWNGLTGSGSKTLTGTITVPTGINPGQIYLRVMLDTDQKDPARGDYTCAVLYGEIQDYVLNVSSAVATPTITGISPTSGATTGGTSVIITGTNFTGATAVKFGSTNASSYTVNSATQITAVSPAGAAGAVDVTVVTTGGTNAISSADQFTYVAAPIVTTNTAGSIATTSALLKGTVNANNASTAVAFEYGLTTSYGTTVTATQSPVTGNTATAVSCLVSGLTPNTTYHFRVNGVNAGGTTNGTDLTFTTALGTALVENENHQLILYPNPITDVFRIIGLHGVSSISLTDLSGRTMLQQQISDNESVSVKTIPAGVYVLKIKNNEGTAERKVVKK